MLIPPHLPLIWSSPLFHILHTFICIIYPSVLKMPAIELLWATFFCWFLLCPFKTTFAWSEQHEENVFPFTQPGQGQGKECQREVPDTRRKLASNRNCKALVQSEQGDECLCPRIFKALETMKRLAVTNKWTYHSEGLDQELSDSFQVCLHVPHIISLFFVTNLECPLLGSQYKGEMTTVESPTKAHQDS